MQRDCYQLQRLRLKKWNMDSIYYQINSQEIPKCKQRLCQNRSKKAEEGKILRILVRNQPISGEIDRFD
jgi:hypothetical protein